MGILKYSIIYAKPIVLTTLTLEDVSNEICLINIILATKGGEAHWYAVTLTEGASDIRRGGTFEIV